MCLRPDRTGRGDRAHAPEHRGEQQLQAEAGRRHDEDDDDIAADRPAQAAGMGREPDFGGKPEKEKGQEDGRPRHGRARLSEGGGIGQMPRGKGRHPGKKAALALQRKEDVAG